jgi:hypothetical protein
MIDPNWTRWITASVALYIKTIVDGLKIPLLVEGIDERSTNITHSHAELRIGGPFAKELSKDYWRLQVDINILLTYLMKIDELNVYDLQTWCGILQVALDGPISIYKYGGETNDDESYVGCLRPKKDRYDANRVFNFGQINRVDRLRQAMIDAQYYMYLDT